MCTHTGPQLSPVHRQVEPLGGEVNVAAMVREPLSQVETLILGGLESPVLEEQAPVMPLPARVTPQREPEPVEEKKRRFGFLGRKEKRPEPRLEPQPAAGRNASSQRATAQVIARPDLQRQTAQPSADDLFPDHKKDDQFEIPAFLRRQTN